MGVLALLKQYLVNSIGWRSKAKIIVFESDDWGMIRTNSREAYRGLINKNYPLTDCVYSTNDALERKKDVEGLVEVLNSHSVAYGQQPIFTLNNVVANPDFDKIRANNFQEYFREPFTETFLKYPQTEGIMSTYTEAFENKWIKPQYHATEHLNVNRWMKALNNGNTAVRDAFEFEMCGVYSGQPSNCRREFLDAFGAHHSEEYVDVASIITTGLDLFKSIWGFASHSFIAPCYIWPASIEAQLADLGIKYLQGTRVQIVPTDNQQGYTKKYHYLGQKSGYGQSYLVRNAFFEPTSDPNKDWVDSCLADIKMAFKFNKPAIISSHRINYIGRLRESNRDTGLRLLHLLLNEIHKHWPEVEYLTSDELGDKMKSQ
jgi:hypothetical protein